MGDMLMTLIEVITSDNNDGSVTDDMLLTLNEATTSNNDDEEHLARLPAPAYPEPPVITSDISLVPDNAGSQQHSAQDSVEQHQRRCINTAVSLLAAATGLYHTSICSTKPQLPQETPMDNAGSKRHIRSC
jgi:hypothetical protein